MGGGDLREDRGLGLYNEILDKTLIQINLRINQNCRPAREEHLY